MPAPTERAALGFEYRLAAAMAGAISCAVIVGLLAVLLVTRPAAALVIGSAKTVVRDVDGITQTSIRRLQIDDNVHRDEIIRTADHSATLLSFADETEFMVGPNSEVTLDRFIFDPRPDQGKLHLRIRIGLLKFRTGSMPSPAYRIRSHVATIGVRGTEFAMHVLSDGTTYVFGMAGVVIVTDNFGRSSEVAKGESAVVYPEGTDDGRFGPVHFSSVDPEFSQRVRRLVALLLLYGPWEFGSLDRMYQAPGHVGSNAPGFDPPERQGRGPIRREGPLPAADLIRTPGPNALGSHAPPANPPETPVIVPTPGGGGTPVIVPTPGGGGTPAPSPAASPIIPSNDGFLRNGDFEAGALFWGGVGAGTFDVLSVTDGSSNQFAELTTGSPIAVSNTLLRTPDHAFRIVFDADFLDGDGVLDILLDARLIASFTAPATAGMQRYEVPVFDAVFGGLTEVDITYLFQGHAAGLHLWLDNVLFEDLGLPFAPPASPATATPTPLGAWLLVGPLLWWVGLLGIRRHRQRALSQ